MFEKMAVLQRRTNERNLLVKAESQSHDSGSHVGVRGDKCLQLMPGDSGEAE
jgi:hypothetical protein